MLDETVCECVNMAGRSQDKIKWRAVMNSVMEFQVHQKARIALTSWATASTSGTIMLLQVMTYDVSSYVQINWFLCLKVFKDFTLVFI
jgi:hypothetical protein